MTHTGRRSDAPEATRPETAVAPGLPTQRQRGAALPALPTLPAVLPPLVPTQRSVSASRTASVHAPLALPGPAAPLGVLNATRAARVTPHRRALRVVAVVGVAALAATATGGWVAQDRAHRALVAQQEARARVDVAVAGTSADGPSTARREVTRAQVATFVAERSDQVTAVEAAVEAATTVLGQTTHAGDAARGALQSAIDAARATAADESSTLTELRAAAASLAGPQKAATDAEAAWVKAEAERKAAEERARQAVQAPRTSRAPSGGGGTAPAPRIPAGGLRCGDTGGSGASEASASSLGAAINAYRSSLGLPTLTVSRSGSLTAHALRMGTAGGIWHSGGDNIVGCAGSAKPYYLVQAWSHSPGHDAQMRRTNVTTMYVGAATQSGWLFGAVLFR
ncbi:CAP domain-containing protein [Cellulomonas persica]|uniref:SCP domain-containing protein n=1 Tax=Cellulomonas persica TaxID=76861 RepID=A0A510UXS9_9CELL|nr:CAP domain-containing protein [Cellulomonas persica]GEK19326.1 hypothetical protein CPE01_30590 [Cellulomonas persica]